MIKTYIVSGSGRVGGNLLTAIINSAGANAVHTHDPLYSTGDDSTTALIMVDRKDVFSVVMSNLLVWHTSQSTEYDNTVEPYVESKKQFELLYRLHKQYAPKHNLNRPYKLIKQFYYEDFVDNHRYVLDSLGLTQIEPVTTKPAPYNYRDIITNHSELKELFDTLEKS